MIAADDYERRRRRADLARKVRGLCLQLGLPAEYVDTLRVGQLLWVYNGELRRQGLHPDQLARLMREPPSTDKAA